MNVGQVYGMTRLTPAFLALSWLFLTKSGLISTPVALGALYFFTAVMGMRPSPLPGKCGFGESLSALLSG